ncbi:MAG TPA: NADH-quinone oxidoreductase subunit A [Gammaproteobacteria bacterium]|nr:NADH-quinone oxidoreductase subunit A [Gammaproteobacteria bacterium]
MPGGSPSTSVFWPLAVFFGAAIILVCVVVLVSWLIGPHHNDPATQTPFESGVESFGDARYRFPVKFYLIAMFFVIFDLESVFLYAGAIALRRVGWSSYFEMVVFIGILLGALAYLWKLGALDFATYRWRQPLGRRGIWDERRGYHHHEGKGWNGR